MTRVAGITVETSIKGNPTCVRIDLRKHAEFIPLLKEKGLEFPSIKDKSKNPAITGVPPRGYVTLEQFAEETKKIINNYCDTYDIH